MRRRVVIAVGLLVMWGGWVGAGRMAGAADDSTVLIPQTSLDQIYKKLDDIAKGQQAKSDISTQLDQMLKNQEAMMADLQIIKIRTLHR